MDDILTCSICGDIFTDVIETPCCNTCYCRECLAPWVAKAKTCPNCRSAVDITKCKPNVPFQRLVHNLPAKCEFPDCKDQVTRGNLTDHVKSCGYAPVECEFGKEQCKGVRKNNSAEHKKDCPFRPRKCDLCAQLLDPAIPHEPLCPMVEILCPQGCNIKVQRGKIKTHLNNECAVGLHVCKFSKYGCNAKIKKADVKEHMKSEERNHLILLETAIKKLEKDNKKLESELKRSKQDTKDLSSALEGLSFLKPQLPFSSLFPFPCVLPSKLMDIHKNNSVFIDDYNIRATRTGVSLGQSFLFSGFGSQNQDLSPATPFLVPANIQIPEIRTSVPYYFEITISNNSLQDHVSIGFITPGCEMRTRLGKSGSGANWGYYVFENILSDYKINQKVPSTQPYSHTPLLPNKNVIGCLLLKGCVSFTVNGKMQEVAFTGLPYKKKLVPAIGIEANNVQISVNFGQSEFLFKDLPSKDLLSCFGEAKCTFTLTQQKHMMQPAFNCATCGYEDNLIVCASCVEKCHKGHTVLPAATLQLGFCDCGLVNKAGSQPFQCKCK